MPETHAKTIWLYWENTGRGMPEFVRHCIDSVYLHRGKAEVHLLNQDSVRQFLPSLRPEWQSLKSPAHKADYVRTRLCLLYGGMWIDCDMAVLSRLDALFDFPEKFDFACQSIGSAIGCFVARPGCKLLDQVTRAQDDVLDHDPLNFPWNGIGNDLLEQFGSQYECHLWKQWTVDEIAGGKLSKLLSCSESIENNVDRNAVVFHLCGNNLTPLLNTYASHQHRNLLREQLLVSKILRRALQLNESGRPLLLPSKARLLDMAAGISRRLARLRERSGRQIPVKS